MSKTFGLRIKIKMNEFGRTILSQTMAKKIRKARQQKGLTQADLAKQCKVPRARIKRIEGLEMNTVDSREYARITTALGLRKSRLPSPKDRRKIQVEAARKVLEENGLLDLTLREILRG